MLELHAHTSRRGSAIQFCKGVYDGSKERFEPDLH